MAIKKFKDYMYYLLHYPIKNKQFYILFTVLGKIFDQIKAMIFEVRRQANILTATGKFLDMFGKEFSMPRFAYESDEAYRKRLLMKTEVALSTGTEKGVILVLQSLGYDEAYTSPLYKEDAARWAEFYLFLNSSTQNKINDIIIIDREVRKVKQASALPVYAIEDFTDFIIKSRYEDFEIVYPLCNTLIAGLYPYFNNHDMHLFTSNTVNDLSYLCEFDYPLCNTIYTQNN